MTVWIGLVTAGNSHFVTRFPGSPIRDDDDGDERRPKEVTSNAYFRGLWVIRTPQRARYDIKINSAQTGNLGNRKKYNEEDLWRRPLVEARYPELLCVCTCLS